MIPIPANGWGLFGAALLATIGLIRATRLRRAPLLSRLPAAALFMAVMLVPGIRGVTPAGYLLAYVGDLSATTMLLLLLSLARTGEPASDWRRPLLLIVLLGGVVLYPLSLGPSPYDPYEWGYRPWALLGAVAVIGFAAARRRPEVTTVLALAVSAYAGNLAASTNLWDYLLDPLLFLYAAWALLLRAVSPAAKRSGRANVRYSF